MRALPFLCALLLGVGAALLAGCGGDRGNLVPAQDAEALKSELQAVQEAASSRRCDASQAALSQARATVKSLPSSVDDALVERLLRGLDRLREKADAECAAAPEVTTTTIPTTSTPVEPPPETTTEETAPTTTQDTAPTTPSVPETTPTDPGTGGVTPDPGTTTGTTPPADGGASPTAPGTGTGVLP